MIQENLFPTVIKGLLRVFVLVALIDGCERGDLLHEKLVRQKSTKRIQSRAYLGVAQENLGLAVALLDRAWPRSWHRSQAQDEGEGVDDLTYRVRYRSHGGTNKSNIG